MSKPEPGAAPSGPAPDPFRQLLDEVGAFVYTIDLQGCYTYANRLVLELLGHPLDYVLGKDISHFFGEKSNQVIRENDARVLRGGETIAREETNLIKATGELRTYWSMKKPLRDAAGNIVGMLGISHDITEKKRLEDRVRKQKELLDTVLDNVDALVYMKDANRRFVYANQHMADVLGLPVERIVGSLDTDLLPRDLADRFWAMDQKIFASGQRQSSEEAVVDACGRLRHYWRVVVPLPAPDGTPAVIGLSTDITELHELKEELRRQASTDGLTGLANRRSFCERAGHEFARSRRHGTPLSLIAIDIDHFKRFNDSYGHPLGDRVLCAFAACCQSMLREADLCARTGGEEFCILLPDTGLDDARRIAERIRVSAGSLCVDGQSPQLRISASFGVASLESGDQAFDTLFSRADRALYCAKQQGRDCIFAWPGG
ncbi:diguanylate cyclase [Alicycliphilus denitrificans]|uniref:Diguanylate cyclase with PAS/PAC sensor n=2 Tax=Alicycliphilus denitrificans TaxID=179636 RepID=F4G7T6_ALIDK|nr:diguanylate cyclase [Alicycliphilus denitrificans]ADU98633.1 diguanylate cyclase [Alicycliphilus denitrificans BC]AEB83239.1 diguanylate cyclase with PAS/PAC sensor [Alicycliphilus denitrificans K601]QKD43008.1 diguanylate cyclase [Alicycliphilus denitrificans]